jgi:adenine-specific DNA-methyltransferase
VLMRGDNLDALRLLRHSYFGKVKLIYIDPPYNTQSDAFIYRDDFSVNQSQVLEQLGYDKDNIEYIKNIYGAKTHSGWLSFMYPRLLLAKDLLRDDGVIFISIDDNEQAQLKLLCDEVFGEQNFFATLVRRAMHTVRNTSKDFNKHADYTLAYAKNKSWFESDPKNFVRQIVDKTDNYTLNDNDGRGFYKLDPLYARNYASHYAHTFKNGTTWQAPDGSYPRYSIDTLTSMEIENRLVFTGKEPKAKRYLLEVQEGQPPNTIMSPEEAGFNSEATSELHEVMGVDKVFSQPKPVKMVKYLMSLMRDKQAIVLDFFAGSGTTGEAVMRLNAEDGGLTNQPRFLKSPPSGCAARAQRLPPSKRPTTQRQAPRQAGCSRQITKPLQPLWIQALGCLTSCQTRML